MVAAAKLEQDKALWDVQQTTIVSPVNAKVFDIIVPGSALLLVNQ